MIRQGKGGGVSSIRAKELVPGDIVEVSGTMVKWVFSKSDLFSELSWIVHNLCCERLIPNFFVFSSCLVVLQYGVVRTILS